ncbi:hypothetical protein WG66_008318 [Moniliophthora roreri]|nr:hypothetical protein WG66_008318 [Moniliophthora roreri]
MTVADVRGYPGTWAEYIASIENTCSQKCNDRNMIGWMNNPEKLFMSDSLTILALQNELSPLTNYIFTFSSLSLVPKARSAKCLDGSATALDRRLGTGRFPTTRRLKQGLSAANHKASCGYYECEAGTIDEPRFQLASRRLDRQLRQTNRRFFLSYPSHLERRNLLSQSARSSSMMTSPFSIMHAYDLRLFLPSGNPKEGLDRASNVVCISGERSMPEDVLKLAIVAMSVQKCRNTEARSVLVIYASATLPVHLQIRLVLLKVDVLEL